MAQWRTTFVERESNRVSKLDEPVSENEMPAARTRPVDIDPDIHIISQIFRLALYGIKTGRMETVLIM